MTGSSKLALQSAVLSLGLLGSSIAATASSGCQLSQDVQVGQTINITSSDDRWYLLHFPKTYEPTSPAPVILSYHGGNRNASEQQALDMLTSTFFNEEYMVIYPNGIDVSGRTTLTPRDCPHSPPPARL